MCDVPIYLSSCAFLYLIFHNLSIMCQFKIHFISKTFLKCLKIEEIDQNRHMRTKETDTEREKNKLEHVVR